MKTKVQQKGFERRRHLRVRRSLAIQHRLYKHKGIVVNGAWRFSTTEDMSLVGILFNSDIPHTQGDILEVRVAMSGLDIFRGFARVVRMQEKSRGVFRIAVAFLDEKSKQLKSF